MVTRAADESRVADEAGLDGVAAGEPVAPGLEVGFALRRVADWRSSKGTVRETVATGFASLDRLLPAGGVRRGSVIEWLAAGDGAAGDAGGAISLACAVACRLADPRRVNQPLTSQASTIVVVDRGQQFYPPAVMPWIDAQAASGPADVAAGGGGRPQFVVARPMRDDDELWTIDQALRCPGVAAVLAWPRRVHATAMRRWQLATRASGAVGLLVRGLSERRCVRGEPTWADAKLAVSPAVGDAAVDLAVRRLRLSLVGGPWSGSEMLEEQSTELLLDLANGREASRRHRMPACPAAPAAAGHLRAGRFQVEDVACRAS